MPEYEIKDTRSGEKTLICHNNGEVRLHSAYDPVKEANRAAGAFEKGRASIILVSGIALGHHISSLKERYPDTLIAAVEHDREVVGLARECYPEHLRDVAVISGPGDLESMMETLDMSGFKGVAHYIHRPSYSLYPDFYEAVMKDMARYISSRISDLLTRFQFEERWIENILQNVPYLYTSLRAGALFGAFRGTPGIIVSAGPSLRKNISQLKELRDRALLLAVDTAYKVMHKNGIAPHIVMTLDAQKYSIKHFTGVPAEETLLCADIVSSPSVVRSFQGGRIISTTSKYYRDRDGSTAREATPFVSWLEKYCGPIGDVQSGGSVATSAFDFLFNMGCSPIILVGQDLAYTGREIHCSGTYHNDDWSSLLSRLVNFDTINQRVVRKRKIKYVESFGGEGPVISDFVFDLYKGWFEDSANKVPVTVINATEGGARIAGTREERLETLAAGMPQLKAAPGSLLKRLMAARSEGGPDELIAGIENVEKKITCILSSAREGLKTGMKLPEIEALLKGDARLFYNPLLRKTYTFLSRRPVSEDEQAKILLKEIILISERLLPQLLKCRDELSM